MTKHDIAKLNKLYTEGESADQPLFAEMRSNVLLYAGESFKNINERLISRLRDSTLTQEQKLKLSINHIQCIVKVYVNNLLSEAPNVHFTAKHEKELASQKDSQLCQAVWADACEKQNFREKRDKFAHTFVTMGEMVGFCYFDPSKGKFKGYKQETNEEGKPLFDHPILGNIEHPLDENGMNLPMVSSDDAVFSGELCMDMIHPTNLKRPSNCESLESSEWLCVEKMVPIEVAKQLLSSLPEEEEEEKEKFITETGKASFTIMDGGRGEYRDTKGMCQLRYYYFRPCPMYPEGYYYITAESSGILLEDKLPYGVFPIVTEGFDDIPGSPRGRSLIKPLRPVQVEINRLASSQALNSILFSDTKVFLPTGTKMTKGNRYDGVREYHVNGGVPVFQEGRAGIEQFSMAIKDKVAEMYKLANIDLEMADGQSTDPTSIIYKSKSQKKKYMLYVQKFEGFLTKLALLYIRLAKNYMTDDVLVEAIGKREQINMAEFKAVNEQSCRIVAVPKTGDADDLFLKHLSLQAALQYGGDIPQHIKSQMISQMPFLSTDGALDSLTLDTDNIESDILALDRGEVRPPSPGDDHELYVEYLGRRKKQSDYRLLPPQVQQNYDQLLDAHNQALADEVKQQKALEDAMIPSGPPFVKCDLYENVKDQNGTLTNKTVKSVFPMGALLWLREKLDSQGQTQNMLQQLGSKEEALDVLLKAGLLNQNYFQQQNPMMQQHLQQQGESNGPALNMQMPQQQHG